MKLKQLLITCFCAVLLVACQASDSSLKEVEKPSDDLAKVINADTTLQLISNGASYYVVYHTTDDVKASSTIEKDTYQIQLDTRATEDAALKEYIYTFNTSDDFDEVIAIVNGKETPFDTVIVNE